MTTGSERAYESLRAAILHGEYSAGEKLSEVALSERLGISRTPVREALRQLARDGLVEVEPNRGARVVSWEPAELADIFRLRAMLEATGAAWAAERRTDAQLDRLAAIVAAMDELPVGPDAALVERTRLNNEFHHEIVLASASVRLDAVVTQLINVPLILRTYSVYSAEALARSQQDHHDLVTAIRVRDPDWARAVMTAHILAAHEQISPRE